MVVITKNITKKYLQPTLFGEDLDRQSPHGIPSQVASVPSAGSLKPQH